MSAGWRPRSRVGEPYVLPEAPGPSPPRTGSLERPLAFALRLHRERLELQRPVIDAGRVDILEAMRRVWR